MEAHAQSLLVLSVLHQNPCTWIEVQEQLKSAFNNSPTLIAEHGKIVSMSHMQTASLNIQNDALRCNGNFSFEDGKTKSMTFGTTIEIPR